MLTGKQRTFLRAEAHLRNPVVQIGKLGITEAALRQISEQLRAHELIKVRFAREAPVGAREAGADVAAQSSSELVQCAGRIIVLYRQNDKDPKIALPGSKAALLIESELKRDPRLSLRRRHAGNRKRRGTRGTRSTGSGKPAREASTMNEGEKAKATARKPASTKPVRGKLAVGKSSDGDQGKATARKSASAKPARSKLAVGKSNEGDQGKVTTRKPASTKPVRSKLAVGKSAAGKPRVVTSRARAAPTRSPRVSKRKAAD